MPKKTHTVKIEVPSRYRWIARQPWGTFVVFAEKPVIETLDTYYDEEAETPKHKIEWWSEKGDTLELGCEGDPDYAIGHRGKYSPLVPTWYKTLRRI